jgi:hypothetical protein
MGTQAPAVTLTKSSTAGKTIVSSTTTPTLGTSGAATDSLASPTLDTSIYPIMGKKFPVGINISGVGGDVEADLQLQFSLNGTDWTEVQGKSEAVLTFTDLPAVDGTVTLTDHAGSSLVYTAKAAQDLGAREFNVTGTAATAAVTFTEAPGASGRITIVSEDGTSVAYVAAAANDFGSGTNEWKADGTKATATITVDNTGSPPPGVEYIGEGDTIALIPTDTVTVTLTMQGTGGSTTSGSTSGATLTAKTLSSGSFATSALHATAQAVEIATAINHHTKFTATNSSNVITVTQVTGGAAGNTAITITELGSTGFSKTDFTGGEFLTAPANLKLAIDNAGGHNGKITVVDDGAGVLTITQLTKGADGNTTITETLANTTATSFTGGEFASAATSLKATIDAVAGHNGTITVADNGAGVLTLTQSLSGSTGNTAVTDALTNFTSSNFTGGSGSSAGIIVSSDIKPNVSGVKLFVADLTDHVGIPYIRFLINSKSLNMGNFTTAWQFAFE